MDDKNYCCCCRSTGDHIMNFNVRNLRLHIKIGHFLTNLPTNQTGSWRANPFCKFYSNYTWDIAFSSIWSLDWWKHLVELNQFSKKYLNNVCLRDSWTSVDWGQRNLAKSST